MNLISIGLAGDGSIEVRPNVGGEYVVDALFKSLTTQIKAVEHCGVAPGSSEFLISGPGIHEEVALSEIEAHSIRAFFQKNDFSVSALGVAPEHGFRFIAR